MVVFICIILILFVIQDGLVIHCVFNSAANIAVTQIKRTCTYILHILQKQSFAHVKKSIFILNKNNFK